MERRGYGEMRLWRDEVRDEMMERRGDGEKRLWRDEVMER